MVDINRKKELRYLFLHKLYELTNGSELKRIAKEDVAKHFDVTPQETRDIWKYLKGEYLAEPVNMAVSITHDGVVEIERAVTEPDKPTQYFPPVNIINVHQMHGSVIQQGTTNSTQTVQITNAEKIAINEFIGKLKSALPELNLDDSSHSEISADIATVEAQIGSERPKGGIIKESLLSIQHVLEGAASAVLAHQLLPYIPALLASFGG
ncbi:MULTISPECIES: hypothetical protein [Shewanella]|nr:MULTISPECIES: hypothetical protein [Shewanella]MBO2629752.1 hypothetical protein [Shewanella algae]NJI85815.1 hypothetical protein [Shewanella sp. Iso12]HDS1200496.1 hypothetical protein [Shewanella algae]